MIFYIILCLVIIIILAIIIWGVVTKWKFIKRKSKDGYEGKNVDNERKILFVTTFNDKIYKTSGYKLLKSYLKFVNEQNNITFNVFTEGNIEINFNRSDINIKKIEDSKYLKNWLNKNKDIIPISLGGNCKKNLPYFNKRASLFFRKIAALYESYDKTFEMIIWLDSDLEITSKIEESFFLKFFNKKDIELYYLYGNYRRNKSLKDNIYNRLGVETAFLVFKKNYNILNEWFKIYEKDFINCGRWDDGWIMKFVLDNTKYKSIDIGGDCDNPLEKSKLKHMFVHNKGIHMKENIIF